MSRRNARKNAFVLLFQMEFNAAEEQEQMTDLFFAEQDEEQQAHGYAAAERRGDGRAFDPKGGEAEMPENERIIPDDVDDVDEKGHLHGIIGHASAPQDGRKGQRDGLKEREPAHDAHIRHAVAHEFGPQFHKAQDAFGPEKEGGADDDAHHHIEGQRYADGCLLYTSDAADE